MAISIGAALLGSAALGVAGAAYSGSQASKASQAQVAATERASQVYQSQAALTREDLAPWRKVGAQALYQYADALGLPAPGQAEAAPFEGFEKSPGYQFRLAEGQKAVERSQAARGLLESGGTMKAIERYGQGIASDEWNNYMNRLSGVAGLGQTATAQTGQFGAAAAGQIGRSTEQAGAARASGYLGRGQAVQQGISAVQSPLGYYVGQQQNQALIEALGRR